MHPVALAWEAEALLAERRRDAAAHRLARLARPAARGRRSARARLVDLFARPLPGRAPRWRPAPAGGTGLAPECC